MLKRVLEDAFGPPQEENCVDKVEEECKSIFELVGSPRIKKEVEVLKGISR